jgi:hypothetical protein
MSFFTHAKGEKPMILQLELFRQLKANLPDFIKKVTSIA